MATDLPPPPAPTKRTKTAHPESGFDVPPMPLWREALAVVTLFIFCNWFYFVLLLTVVLAFQAIVLQSPVAIALGVVLLTTALHPLDFTPREQLFRPLLRLWIQYFAFTRDNHHLVGQGKHIFIEHPHGVFPFGQLLSVDDNEDLVPGDYVCGVAASIIFAVPGMRHFFAGLGIRPATPQHIADVLKTEHQHCAVIMGGIKELFMASEDKERFYMRRRKGAIRLAMHHGADLVPVVFYGNTKILKLIGSNSRLVSLSRRLRLSIAFFTGRFGITVPYRHRLHMASEHVVKVEKNENPTDEELESVMQELTEAMRKLYYDHRPTWETRDLEII